MIAYGVFDTGDFSPETVVTFATGLFVVPFILLPFLGSDIADRMDKGSVIRYIKLAEIGIAILAVVGFIIGSIFWLMSVLLLFGVQSALFSPAKFAIIPQHLKTHELIAGNALVNTGTFLAILMGTLLGSWLSLQYPLLLNCSILILCALAGYSGAMFIPAAPSHLSAAAKKEPINSRILIKFFKIFGFIAKQKADIRLALLGSGFFFFFAAIYLAQLPNYTSLVLNVHTDVLTLFMTVFSLGVVIGGLLNNRLLKGTVSIRFVPYAAFAIGLFSFDFFRMSLSDVFPIAISIPQEGVQSGADILMFLSLWQGWWILFDLFALALAGGIYMVPLKTLIQDRLSADKIAETVAAGSIVDALFMLCSAIVALAIYGAGFEVHYLFAIIGFLSIINGLYIWREMKKI